jgi:hypothetical protein
MYLSVRRSIKGLHGVIGHLLHGYPLSFDPTKKTLLDKAFGHIATGARSFADLGGVWRVDAAYTFYVLDHFPIEKAYLVDTDFTAAVKKRTIRYPRLTMIHGNFGKPEVVQQMGRVDAVLFFDVLLHQVKPNWDDILRMYAEVTDCLVIYNQQFIESEKTVRLIDLGVDEYFRHVRFDRGNPLYRDFLSKMDEIHPEHQKPWRDIHNVWQWGITDRDLIATAQDLGFRLEYRVNHGQFSNFKTFENHAFVFVK